MTNTTFNGSLTSFNSSAYFFPVKPNWSPYPVFLTVLIPLTIVVNSFLLVIFLTTRGLRTTFNVYVINLLLADFLLCAAVFSLDVVSAVSPRWFLGEDACSLYGYLAYLLNGWTLNAHALLGINRLWAVFFPLHYRQHQTRGIKIAVYLCIGTFVYVNIMIAPGVIRDALHYRLPLNKFPCFLNAPAQRAWATTVQLLVYDLQWAFLIVSMPLIWYRRSRRNPNRIAGRTNGEAAPSVKVTEVARARKEQSFFKVWLVLTISTLVLWAPLLLYYALDLAIRRFPRTLFQAGRVLFSFTVLMDPVLFIVMMPEIRTRMRAWFCGCFSNGTGS